jgi:glycosyltransferase involved in cell wall biosynthesis
VSGDRTILRRTSSLSGATSLDQITSSVPDDGRIAMRFLCLHHGDILSEKLWSGIPLNIIHALRAQGHEVIVEGNLYPDTTFIGRVKGVLYKVLLHKLYLVDRDPHTHWRRSRDANRRIRAAGRVDGVIVTQLGDAAYLKSEAPIITIHDATFFQMMDYYPGYPRSCYAKETIQGAIALDKMGLERAAHCIFSSQWAADSAHHDYGIPFSKLSVAPLGANLSKVPTREECLWSFNQRGFGACKFLFLGKEWYRKGGDIAIEILNELSCRGLPVELHIVGCSPEGEVPSFVKSHGELWKRDPRQANELDSLFQSCDFFILPTRAECFGLVFCEAAAYGLPVVTLATGGVPEVVSPDWSLALPPPPSPFACANWILENYRDREKYLRLAHSARTAYEQKLNWQTICHHIVQVTKELEKSTTVPLQPVPAS